MILADSSSLTVYFYVVLALAASSVAVALAVVADTAIRSWRRTDLRRARSELASDHLEPARPEADVPGQRPVVESATSGH